jgi:hypothetical protein
MVNNGKMDSPIRSKESADFIDIVFIRWSYKNILLIYYSTPKMYGANASRNMIVEA